MVSLSLNRKKDSFIAFCLRSSQECYLFGLRMGSEGEMHNLAMNAEPSHGMIVEFSASAMDTEPSHSLVVKFSCLVVKFSASTLALLLS